MRKEKKTIRWLKMLLNVDVPILPSIGRPLHLLLALLFVTFVGNVFGGDWYVRPTSAGSANGRDWNNAWGLSNLSGGWSSVQPGDTVWIAGGTYSGGMTLGKSGTAANPIYVRRVLSGDAVPTAAAGWNASFDSRPVFTSSSALRTPVAYVIVDGRIDMGMRFVASNSGGLPASADVTGGNHIVLTNLDLVGPNSVGFDDGTSCGNTLVNFNGDCSGVMIGYGYSPNPGADYITVSHCRVRGHPNEFWFAQARNITIEHSKIYDNGAANSATWHGNLMIVNGSDGIVFRYNDVSNWQVEGLYPWGSASRNWYVYGNVFHDGYNGISGSTHRFLEIRSYSGTVTHGPMWIYNNTITRCWAAIRQGDTTVFWSSDTVIRNNLVYNLANSGIGYTSGTINDHNVSASSDPFVNTGSRDYHITSTSSARNVGVAVPTVSGHTFSFDKDGSARGTDGSWDAGAFEFGSAGPSTNPVVSVTPNSLDYGTIASSASKELTLTVRNLGSGVLAGTATVSSPFTIVSGASYSLSGNQTQSITVRYNPAAAGSHVQTVTFTGGGGAAVTVRGAAFAMLPGLSFESYAGTITAPFVTSGNYIAQSSETSVTAGGQAVYGITIPAAGSYVVQININAPNDSANSLFVNFDGQPTDPAMIWDIPLTTGFVNQNVSWRGNGTFDNPQYVPAVFNLTAGTHQLILRGREGGVQIGRITVAPAGGIPSPPQNLRVTASL